MQRSSRIIRTRGAVVEVALDEGSITAGGLQRRVLELEPDSPLYNMPAAMRLTGRFDEEHRRLFTFNMDTPHEIVNLRAVAQGQAPALPAAELPKGDGNPAAAKIRDHVMWIGGEERAAVIYDRAKLRQGDVIEGPAIITEMDSTTLVEHDCRATVDAVGNILITLKAEG